MEPLFILMFVIAVAWWFGQGRKAEREAQERAEAAQRQAAENHVEDIEAVSKAAAQQHMRVLWSKWKQLCYTDDYGNFVDDAWRRELRYFVDTVVAPQFTFDPITSDGDIEQAVSTVGFEVLEYELGMDELPSGPPSDAYRPQMTGVEFEQMVECILSSAGAKVTRTPVTGDQGVDLLAECDGITIAIQCKRCATPLGNKAVQEVNAGRDFYSADLGWVVSDANFTKSARQLASSLNIDLVQYLNVREQLERAVA